MSLKSLTALADLRALQADKQKEKTQILEIQSQHKKISALHEEKEALYRALLCLEDGEDPLSVFNQLDSPEVHGLRREFAELKEKIEAHKVIGPCGLTVLEQNSNYLEVSFTCFWKKFSKSYLLKIAFEENKYKVRGSTIPYFLNIQSLIDKESSPNWSYLFDKISNLISAYIQRKGELEYVKNNPKALVSSLSANDPVTFIDLKMSFEHTDGIHHNLHCNIHYDSLWLTLPSDVELETDSSLLSEELLATVRSKLLSEPLSSAFSSMVDDSFPGSSSNSTETSLGMQQSPSQDSSLDMLDVSNPASMFSSPLESNSSRIQDSAGPIGKKVLGTVVE